MGICPTSSKIRTTIFFGDGTTRNIETPGNITITVNNNPNLVGKKCFRYSAIGGKNPAYPSPYLYEYYACGTTAGYTSIGITNNPIWTGDSTQKKFIGLMGMVLDGQRIFQDNYFSFGAGFEELEEITNFPIANNNAVLKIGNCNSCGIETGNCQLTIKSSSNIILFQVQGKCPITYETNCDDDCHDGCCKIITQSYPGYCCAKSP